MPKLTKMTLLNYKSITSATVDFSDFTVLLGRNGSGKSNVADALAFMAEATVLPLPAVFNRRGGPAGVIRKRPIRTTSEQKGLPMGLAFEFDNLQPPPQPDHPGAVRIKSARYAVEIHVGRFGFDITREQCWVSDHAGNRSWFDRKHQEFASNVDFLKDLPESIVAKDALAIPLVGGIQPFRFFVGVLKSMGVYAIDPSKLREFQDPDSGARLLPDGSNAASVLRELSTSDPDRVLRLFEVLASVVPELRNARAHISGRKQILKFTQRWSEKESLTFDSFNMSDGTLRAFGLLLAIFQIPRPSIIVIEEPEISLHPAATSVILDLLKSISSNTQVICTTHSAEVLDHIEPSGDNLRVVTWKDGETRVGQVAGVARHALEEHLSTAGELLRMRILDAEPIFDESVDPQRSLFEEVV